MTLTKTIAAKVTANSSVTLGIEAVSILLSLLANCFFKNDANESKTPREHLAEHWNPVSQTFDQETINGAYPSACKSIRIAHRKHGEKRLKDFTRIEIVDGINAALYESMNQPTNVAMAVYEEAPNYGDEDDDGTDDNS